jgi:hypothetical protein
MASRYGIHMAQRREQLAVVEVSTRTAVKHFLKFDLAEAACERLNRDAEARGVVSADGSPRYIVDLVPLQETTVRAPSLAELRADPVGGAWWEPEDALDAHGKRIYHAEGYKAIDQWIWDPRILDPETLNDPKPRPLGTLPRLLMSLYQSRGLMSEFAPSEQFPEGKKSGFLRMHQAEAARLLGCSRRSIYRANCLWEKLGVLRAGGAVPAVSHPDRRGMRRRSRAHGPAGARSVRQPVCPRAVGHRRRAQAGGQGAGAAPRAIGALARLGAPDADLLPRRGRSLQRGGDLRRLLY